MLISIAIPCYKSANNLEKVVDEIKNEFSKRQEHTYEIVLVCDGSPDNTDEVIREICSNDKNVKGVLLSRNFTQTNAKMAALPYVKGDVLIYMDDDGQHPVEGIFSLVEKIEEGYDVVYAHFVKKKQNVFRILSSRIDATIREKLGVKPANIFLSSFSAFSRFAYETLREYHSPSPSTVAYLLSVTTKFANVEFEQRSRMSGRSSYTFKKLVALAIQGYVNFTMVPLRIVSFIGALFVFIGFVYSIILVIRRLLFDDMLLGYTSIISFMILIGGLIILSLGLVGEYIGRIYILLSDKPQFVVKEEINVEIIK